MNREAYSYAHDDNISQISFSVIENFSAFPKNGHGNEIARELQSLHMEEMEGMESAWFCL